MLKLLGRRGMAAALTILSFAVGAAPATAKDKPLNLAAVTYNLNADQRVKPLGTVVGAAAAVALPAAKAAAAPATQATAVATAIQTVSGSLLPASAALLQEANWLRKGGWPLHALVDKYATNAPLDAEMTCLATAVYFEARGETAEGQLAVARVVMNRAASGKYPPTWCATVKQPWQFSFVRNGQFPRVDTECAAWRRAQAIALLAAGNVVQNLPSDVLWYHADYVSPAWGPRLNKVEKIGAHIFYRA